MSGLTKIEALKTVLTAFLAWVVVMGFWPMTGEQQAITLTFGISIINFGGAFWQSQSITTLSNPKSADGEELVRISGSPRSAASKQKVP